jgi:hypothetical protein
MVVTCSTVLPNLLQDELFQIQLVFIFPTEAATATWPSQAHADHSYMLNGLGLQKQGRGHAKAICFVLYAACPRNPSRCRSHAQSGDPACRNFPEFGTYESLGQLS